MCLYQYFHTHSQKWKRGWLGYLGKDHRAVVGWDGQWAISNSARTRNLDNLTLWNSELAVLAELKEMITSDFRYIFLANNSWHAYIQASAELVTVWSCWQDVWLVNLRECHGSCLFCVLGKSYCCHRLGKAVRMLPGASARELCVQQTLEVFLQEENVEEFLNLP